MNAANAAAGARHFHFTATSRQLRYGIFIECTVDTGVGDCTATGASRSVVEIGHGTSASAPSFAGVVALADQAIGGRLGNINPLLYALNQSTPTAYHDITTGNNEVITTGILRIRPSRWQQQALRLRRHAGLRLHDRPRVIDSTSLVNALVALGRAQRRPVEPPAPTATTEGNDVTLTATVNVEGTNSNSLGGDGVDLHVPLVPRRQRRRRSLMDPR